MKVIDPYELDLSPSFPIPLYGSYGGPGYTANKTTQLTTQDFLTQPKDQLDNLFRTHDWQYSFKNIPHSRQIADTILLTNLQSLPFSIPKLLTQITFETKSIIDRITNSTPTKEDLSLTQNPYFQTPHPSLKI